MIKRTKSIIIFTKRNELCGIIIYKKVRIETRLLANVQTGML